MEDLFQKILKVFAGLGLWADGIELIGSWSFLLYQRHLGVKPLPLRTQDVDIPFAVNFLAALFAQLALVFGSLHFWTSAHLGPRVLGALGAALTRAIR